MGYRSTIEGTFSWTDHPLPLGIKVVQRYRTKMDFVAYQRLADRDGFADEGFAEEDEFSPPPDLTVGAHSTDGCIGCVERIFHPRWIGPG